MASSSTRLQVSKRDPGGSRTARRLRRRGRVPGVIYGGAGEPVSIDVDARELRLALAASGAVLDVSVDGASPTPAVLKDTQRDVVRGDTVHVDLLRVRLDRAIQTVVALELTGVEDAPGVKEGGVLEHITRELNVEALPTAIPESIIYDTSAMEINDTVTLDAVSVPDGVSLLDDPETTVATLSPPRLQVEDDTEIEQETGVVGEGEGPSGEGDSPAGEAGAEEAGS